MKKHFILIAALSLFSLSQQAQNNYESVNCDFEDLSLETSSHYGGASSPAGNFSSKGIIFPHKSSEWSWSGFSYSNEKDVTTEGFANQFSVFNSQGGANASKNFGIGTIMWDYNSGTYGSDTLFFDIEEGVKPEMISFNNMTYPALSMKNGDDFAKKFGGASGEDKDSLVITVYGINTENENTSKLTFYLADFRGESTEDYIIDQWTNFDLTTLGENIKALVFSMESSDFGEYGPNTPLYFAFDDLKYSKKSITDITKLNDNNEFYLKNNMLILNEEYNGFIFIYDITGKIVLNNINESFRLNNLDKGIYIIKSNTAICKILVK